LVCLSVDNDCEFFSKAADWIEMLFGMVGLMGPGNSILEGGADYQWKGKFRREMGHCNVMYMKNVALTVQK